MSFFRQLAMAEMDSLYRLACHLAHHAQQAEDYVQENLPQSFPIRAHLSLSGIWHSAMALQDSAQRH